MPWNIFKIRKELASWLSACHHGLQWENGMVPYNEAKRLFTTAVFEDDVVVHQEMRKTNVAPKLASER